MLAPFSDLIPHAPSSVGPVRLTKAKVKPGTSPASTISCTVSTNSGVRTVGKVPLGEDHRSLPVVAPTALWSAIAAEMRNKSGLMTPIDRGGIVWGLEAILIDFSRPSWPGNTKASTGSATIGVFHYRDMDSTVCSKHSEAIQGAHVADVCL
jgi:hypothetical protein